MTNDEKYMTIAYKEAIKAFKNNEIPVGCVIVKNDKIIAKSYNKKEKNNNVIDHAEIRCISKTCKKMKNWRLDDCTIYITMEPCMMCCGAIEQARISKIVYATHNENFGYTCKLTKTKIVNGILENECKTLIQSFFKKIR